VQLVEFTKKQTQTLRVVRHRTRNIQ